MPKWLKFIFGLLLLPVCAGAGMATWRVIEASGRADTVWIAGLAGALCWLAIYVILPRPMWIYVVGHELTHAVWTWSMGGKVKRFKVSSKGGHVVVTKSNFLIALAPYFFPLYAVLVVLLFVVLGFFVDLQRHTVWFHLLLGAAYAFHITLTLHALKHSQTDITSQGYLFSITVIFLGNALVLLVGIPLIARQVTVLQGLTWWWQSTVDLVQMLARVRM